MSHPPPIPQEQRGPQAQKGRGPDRPDLSTGHETRRERRSGVADTDFNPDQQGRTANLRQTDGRHGKTQDR
jgi:hypothetical protein